MPTEAGLDVHGAEPARAGRTAPDVAGVEYGYAKINLALHVTGRRPDGYHLLHSLVVFADWADELNAEHAPDGRTSLSVEGPLAGTLADATGPENNLVIRAANRLARAAPAAPPAARLMLTKRVPVAAGLGGGSADAAATLRILNRHWRTQLDDARLAELGLGLGADVPMCVYSRPVVAEGIGERITLVPGIPALPVVLVHPGVPMATAAVFRRLERVDGSHLPKVPARFATILDFVSWLRDTRNDLSEPANAENPLAGAVVMALAADADCLLARMSGSGAAAFGIFPSDAAAERAAARLRTARPDWWVAAARTGGS